MHDQISAVVLIGGLTIDDHEFCAATFGQRRKARSGIHHQGRSEHDEEIAGRALGLGADHGGLRHGLTEGNRRRLDDAIAVSAYRQRLIPRKGRHDRRKLVTPAAVEAASVSAIAMQLDDLVSRHTRGLMQAIDVLRDDGAQRAACHQRRQRAMAAIGCGLLEVAIDHRLASPGFAPHIDRIDEVAKVDGLHARPDATGTAEIRNAGLGADAGAGEGDDALTAIDECGESRARSMCGLYHRILVKPALLVMNSARHAISAQRRIGV